MFLGRMIARQVPQNLKIILPVHQATERLLHQGRMIMKPMGSPIVNNVWKYNSCRWGVPDPDDDNLNTQKFSLFKTDLVRGYKTSTVYKTHNSSSLHSDPCGPSYNTNKSSACSQEEEYGTITPCCKPFKLQKEHPIKFKMEDNICSTKPEKKKKSQSKDKWCGEKVTKGCGEKPSRGCGDKGPSKCPEKPAEKSTSRCHDKCPEKPSDKGKCPEKPADKCGDKSSNPC